MTMLAGPMSLGAWPAWLWAGLGWASLYIGYIGLYGYIAL